MTTLLASGVSGDVFARESGGVPKAQRHSGPRSLILKNDLQGMRFIGPLEVKGQPGSEDEVLTFKGGMFSSKVCLQYGYAPVPYWVRRDADGIHFFAKLEHPTNGTIRFEGVFNGRAMRASALWKKKRWYWTIEQTLLFEGHVSKKNRLTVDPGETGPSVIDR